MSRSLFIHCRAGFEGECTAEVQEQAAALGRHGHCRSESGGAWVEFATTDPDGAARLHEQIAFVGLIFARQWFVVSAACGDLPVGDRAASLARALRTVPAPAGTLFLEYPDTNDGKALSGLCRKLRPSLEAALSAAGLLDRDGATRWRLHACFLSGTAAYAGYADTGNSSPWPMGVPRLKFPRGAPSRSTLKLEEALLCFLDDDERRRALLPGMRAVDLGAAPGGWTWQLVQRGLHVTAVDNGALTPALLESGLVEHLRGDGFAYRPAASVAWMVCDIVERPMRVAGLAAKWLENGWCRHAVFNLKLPMKKRYQEVKRCLDHVRGRLDGTGVDYRLACKQLYHDRDEVTVYVQRRR